MASNITEQVISEASQLAYRLEELYGTVSNLTDTNDILAHLTDIDQDQEALTTLQNLACNTESITEGAVDSIAESFSRIIVSLDQLQTLRSSLIGRTDPISQLDPEFLDIAHEVYGIFESTRAMPGRSAVDAAAAADLTLQDRIQPLLTSGQIPPEKVANGQRFLESFLGAYINAFEMDFTNIRHSSEGDVATDFYSVLGLFKSLDNFSKTREITSEPLRQHRDTLFSQIHNALTVYIASQIENEELFPATAGAAVVMEAALNEIISPQPAAAPVATETEEEDPQALADALALSQTPQTTAPENDIAELIAGLLLSMQAQSSTGSAEQSHSREILERKLHSAEFLNTMSALSGADDLGNLQELTYALEDLDADAANALFALLQGLHTKLNKGQSVEGYGRLAFFNSNTTPAEREEVIKRALVLTLIDGIKETIKADDIAQLRATLELLSAIRLDQSFQTYRNKDLASLIHGHLYKAHVAAGRPSSERKHGHFGAVALRDLEGFTAPKAVKLDAINRLETELKGLWNI